MDCEHPKGKTHKWRQQEAARSTGEEPSGSTHTICSDVHVNILAVSGRGLYETSVVTVRQCITQLFCACRKWYSHVHLAQVAVAVLDNVGVFGAIEHGDWTPLTLGPDIVVSWVNGHCHHVDAQVTHEHDTRTLSSGQESHRHWRMRTTPSSSSPSLSVSSQVPAV